jgi:hypothetical protein
MTVGNKTHTSSCKSAATYASHLAEGLLDPKVLATNRFLTLDTPARACRFRKYQIENSSLFQIFSKREFESTFGSTSPSA